MTCSYAWCWCAGPVHESLQAGRFMPGNGNFPIGKIGEKDLKLLRTRSELLEPENKPGDTRKPSGPVNEEVGDTLRDESPATTVPGHPAGDKSMPPPPPAMSTRSSPPSPVSSLRSMGTSSSDVKSKNSTKYDKYKDGSYWKRLNSTKNILCFIQYDYALSNGSD